MLNVIKSRWLFALQFSIHFTSWQLDSVISFQAKSAEVLCMVINQEIGILWSSYIIPIFLFFHSLS